MNIFTHPTARNLKRLAICALLSFGALSFQSCSKTEAQVQEISYLTIVNTSPTGATYNIYVDQVRINNSGNVAYGGNTGYLQTPPGIHNVKFTTGSSTESVINKNFTLENNGIYSVFLVDRDDKMELLQFRDKIGSVTSEKAFVRFINLSPDAPALSLAVKDGNTIITDKAYKSGSDFIEVDAKTYIFEIKGATTTPALASTELKAGKSYTVIARGLITPGQLGRAFDGQIITNQ